MRASREEGSLLLTMLLVIAVAGMIAATFTMVQTSQTTTRRDRNWTESIQVAEAGLSQAYSYLSTTLPPSDTVASDDATLAFDQQAGNGGYRWTARKVGTDWLLRSEGTVNGVTRVVEAIMTQAVAGDFAMFSDDFLKINGGGRIRSYDSNGGLRPCSTVAAGVPCSSKGYIGTNSYIQFNGDQLDLAFIYGATSGDTGLCAGCPAYTTVPEEYDMSGMKVALATEAAAACPNKGLGNYDIQFPPYPILAGGTYCVDDLLFNGPSGAAPAQAFVVDGSGAYASSNDNPAIIYVYGSVLQPNNKKAVINCKKPDGSLCPALQGTVEPDYTQQPGGLQIKVVGESAGTVVQLQQQSVYTMTITAPNSTCDAPGGQSTIYGFIICKKIGTNGGYDIMYDESVIESGTGLYRLVGYREELVSTTGFPPPAA